MTYQQITLPYSDDALEPVISKETISYHYYKHHAGYVNATNSNLELLAEKRSAKAFDDLKGMYKNLSFNLNGHLLHDLYWSCMRAPNEENIPEGGLFYLIEKSFGDFETFRLEFSELAKTVEGSGWAIVQTNGEKLILSQVEKHNLLPIVGYKAILCIDVWEHAYYVDYKNDRGKYVDEWWNVVNWEFVEKQIMD